MQNRGPLTRTEETGTEIPLSLHFWAMEWAIVVFPVPAKPLIHNMRGTLAISDLAERISFERFASDPVVILSHLFIQPYVS